MSRVEELLRDALAEAPTPERTRPDPVAWLDGAVRRARRRRRVAAVVATVAAVAAVAVPTVVLHSGSGSSGLPTHQPSPVAKTALVTWPDPGNPTAVTSTPNGIVWVLSERSQGNTPYDVVEQRDPYGGTVLRSTGRLAPPLDGLAYGLGRVWAFGGGDGGYPQSQITVIDTGANTGPTLTIPAGQGGPQSVAFAHGSAWFVLNDTGRVLRVTLVGNHLRSVSFPFTQGPNATISTTGNGQLWLATQRRITRIKPTATSGVLTESFAWPGPAFAPTTVSRTSPAGLWTLEGRYGTRARVVSLNPQYLSAGVSVAYSRRYDQGFAASAARQDAAGLWMAGDGHLAFIATRHLDSASQPDDVLRFSATTAVYSIAPAGGHSVVFVTDDSKVHRWTPRVP